ncbi:MAG: sulfotransferase domain-containing protein [Phycisphaeraceae bacterium]|nr:sulfotransferase domain-containing protein [Phycisphaeraceae bacterium]
MEAPKHTKLLLSSVRAFLPRPVRSAIRPAIQVVAPRVLAPRAALPIQLEFCDHPTTNRWTVFDPRTGVEHRFFFLCGCWKSGTHWVQAILNLHPEVWIRGEYHFEHLMRAMDRFTLPSWYICSRGRGKRVARESFENLVRRTMYCSTRDCPSAVWLGDRTPRLLREVLPGAPTLWLVRDGRDVLVSWTFHWLRVEAAGPPFARLMFARFRPEFARDADRFRDPEHGLLGSDIWVRRTARAWARYISHDFDAFPRLRAQGTPVHKIVYEDLHQNPHNGAEAIYRFLNLDPAEAEPLSVETKTLPGFKQEDLKSATRKGQSGDWRNYFNDRIKRIFKEEAGEALILAGYEKDLNW